MILTGDLHASPDELQYLKPEYLRKKYKSKCENTFIVILGDGGFLWHEDSYSDFNGELINTLNNWMKELNSTLIVIPGNHENYDILDNLEISEWHGGLVNFVRKSVIILYLKFP